MMRSGDGNAFHITGLLWGKPLVTGHCWFPWQRANRVDSRFATSQWERVLLCNVSHWLGNNPRIIPGPIMHSLDFFFVVSLNMLRNKEFSYWLFEAPWCSCNITVSVSFIFKPILYSQSSVNTVYHPSEHYVYYYTDTQSYCSIQWLKWLSLTLTRKLVLPNSLS